MGTHSSGTLSVLTDDAAAIEEYQRCESAVTLRCYRADNVVIFFADSAPPEYFARLESMLRSMAAGD